MLPIEDMSLTEVAEELGALREALKLAKEREAELREALLRARPNGPFTTGGFEVTLKRGTARRFDKTRLPVSIHNDPRYWTTTETVTVHTRRTRSKLDTR